MGRATEEALDELHALAIKKITAELKKDDVSPQMLAQALKALRDNGIDAPASSKRFDGLAAALDDLDYEAIGSAAAH